MPQGGEGEARTQVILLPKWLDDYASAENPVRMVDVFVDDLELGSLGFERVDPAATRRPTYLHSAVYLQDYIHGYLNRTQFSLWLEREAERDVGLMSLMGRLAPIFKTILLPGAAWWWPTSQHRCVYEGQSACPKHPVNSGHLGDAKRRLSELHRILQ